MRGGTTRANLLVASSRQGRGRERGKGSGRAGRGNAPDAALALSEAAVLRGMTRRANLPSPRAVAQSLRVSTSPFVRLRGYWSSELAERAAEQVLSLSRRCSGRNPSAGNDNRTYGVDRSYGTPLTRHFAHDRYLAAVAEAYFQQRPGLPLGPSALFSYSSIVAGNISAGGAWQPPPHTAQRRTVAPSLSVCWWSHHTSVLTPCAVRLCVCASVRATGWWHMDQPSRGIKAMIYLDDVSMENGPFAMLQNYNISRDMQLADAHCRGGAIRADKMDHRAKYCFKRIRIPREEMSRHLRHGAKVRAATAPKGTVWLPRTCPPHP